MCVCVCACVCERGHPPERPSVGALFLTAVFWCYTIKVRTVSCRLHFAVAITTSALEVKHTLGKSLPVNSELCRRAPRRTRRSYDISLPRPSPCRLPPRRPERERRRVAAPTLTTVTTVELSSLCRQVST